MTSDSVDSLKLAFEERCELYAFPPAVADVLRMSMDPEVDVDDVTAAVEREVSMALRLVELSNSALFARADQVSSVGEAVRFLGQRNVRTVAASLLLRSLRTEDNVRAEAIRNYWQHAVLSAVAARGIARLNKLAHPDEAYLSGLLMDVAYPILVDLSPERYVETIGQPGVAHPDEVDEFELLGITHAELAAWMLRRWGLPDHVVEGVSGHHFPRTVLSPEKAKGLAQTLNTAHKFASKLRSGDDPKLVARDLADIVLEGNASPVADMDGFVRGFQADVTELAALLEIELDDEAELNYLLSQCAVASATA